MGEKSIGKWRMCEQLATMKNDTKTKRQNADRRCSVKAGQLDQHGLDRLQRIQLSALAYGANCCQNVGKTAQSCSRCVDS